MAAERQVDLRKISVGPHGDAIGDKLVQKSGKQLGQNRRAACQQNMTVRR
jgi:hypothetical protein